VRKTDGSWCRSEAERSVEFADLLHTAFTPFDRCTAKEQAATIRSVESPSAPGPLLQPVAPEGTAQNIASLRNGKSPGPDRIDAIALKMLPVFRSQLLANIFNSCFRLGYFPKHWKRAEVITILEPGKLISLLANTLKSFFAQSVASRRGRSDPRSPVWIQTLPWNTRAMPPAC